MARRQESAYSELFAGSELQAEEVEFIMAIERYKREQGRPFPTWHEVLAVALSLGYRKVAPPRRPKRWRPPGKK